MTRSIKTAMSDLSSLVDLERHTNAHDVPMRRVVLYGPEECDPAVPTKP